MKISKLEIAWQIRPLPKLMPNLGYNGSPFWGYQNVYSDGNHRMFGFWFFSIHWSLD